MLSAYRPLFTSRPVFEVWIASLLGRLQLGTLPLAIIFCVQERGGSAALTGAAVGAVTLTTALSATPKGRLIDRLGARRPIVWMGVLHLLCLIAIALLPFSAAMVIAFCLLAGLVRPNLTTYMRVLWRAIHEDEELRERASALEAAASPLITISGPIIIAALYALAGAPVALIVSGALTAMGSILFALSALQPSPEKSRSRLPMPWAGLILILPAAFFNQTGIGVLQVAVPEWAKAEGSLAASGALMACWGAGALIGGLLYGTIRWRSSPQARLLFLALTTLVFACALPFVSGWAQMALLLILIGGPSTAIIACIQYLMQSLSPPGRDTEVLSWWVSVGAVGIAAGSFLAGLLAQEIGASAALMACAGAALLTCLLAFLARRVKQSELS